MLLTVMHCYSAVAGSMMVVTREILLAGNPPSSACLHQRFVGGVVNTVDFVGGYVAVDPLHAGPEAAEHPARLQRDVLELGRAQFTRAGNFPFNDEFRLAVSLADLFVWTEQ